MEGYGFHFIALSCMSLPQRCQHVVSLLRHFEHAFIQGCNKALRKETNAMRAKYWTKRMLSGVLSAVMVLSVAAGPVSALASDTKTDPKKNLEEYVSSLPDLDDARDSLDRDEIVTAKSIELDYGAEIDLKEDFTGIRIPDKQKISVSFYEAKNEDGKSFTTSRADTYKAVYYAEPVNTEHEELYDQPGGHLQGCLLCGACQHRTPRIPLQPEYHSQGRNERKGCSKKSCHRNRRNSIES